MSSLENLSHGQSRAEQDPPLSEATQAFLDTIANANSHKDLQNTLEKVMASNADQAIQEQAQAVLNIFQQNPSNEVNLETTKSILLDSFTKTFTENKISMDTADIDFTQENTRETDLTPNSELNKLLDNLDSFAKLDESSRPGFNAIYLVLADIKKIFNKDNDKHKKIKQTLDNIKNTLENLVTDEEEPYDTQTQKEDFPKVAKDVIDAIVDKYNKTFTAEENASASTNEDSDKPQVVHENLIDLAEELDNKITAAENANNTDLAQRLDDIFNSFTTEVDKDADDFNPDAVEKNIRRRIKVAERINEKRSVAKESPEIKIAAEAPYIPPSGEPLLGKMLSASTGDRFKELLVRLRDKYSSNMAIKVAAEERIAVIEQGAMNNYKAMSNFENYKLQIVKLFERQLEDFDLLEKEDQAHVTKEKSVAEEESEKPPVSESSEVPPSSLLEDEKIDPFKAAAENMGSKPSTDPLDSLKLGNDEDKPKEDNPKPIDVGEQNKKKGSWFTRRWAANREAWGGKKTQEAMASKDSIAGKAFAWWRAQPQETKVVISAAIYATGLGVTGAGIAAVFARTGFMAGKKLALYGAGAITNRALDSVISIDPEQKPHLAKLVKGIKYSKAAALGISAMFLGQSDWYANLFDGNSIPGGAASAAEAIEDGQDGASSTPSPDPTPDPKKPDPFYDGNEDTIPKNDIKDGIDNGLAKPETSNEAIWSDAPSGKGFGYDYLDAKKYFSGDGADIDTPVAKLFRGNEPLWGPDSVLLKIGWMQKLPDGSMRSLIGMQELFESGNAKINYFDDAITVTDKEGNELFKAVFAEENGEIVQKSVTLQGGIDPSGGVAGELFYKQTTATGSVGTGTPTGNTSPIMPAMPNAPAGDGLIPRAAAPNALTSVTTPAMPTVAPDPASVYKTGTSINPQSSYYTPQRPTDMNGGFQYNRSSGRIIGTDAYFNDPPSFTEAGGQMPGSNFSPALFERNLLGIVARDDVSLNDALQQISDNSEYYQPSPEFIDKLVEAEAEEHYEAVFGDEREIRKSARILNRNGLGSFRDLMNLETQASVSTDPQLINPDGIGTDTRLTRSYAEIHDLVLAEAVRFENALGVQDGINPALSPEEMNIRTENFMQTIGFYPNENPSFEEVMKRIYAIEANQTVSASLNN